MSSLPSVTMFREVQLVHETGFFPGLSSIDDSYQEASTNWLNIFILSSGLVWRHFQSLLLVKLMSCLRGDFVITDTLIVSLLTYLLSVGYLILPCSATPLNAPGELPLSFSWYRVDRFRIYILLTTLAAKWSNQSWVCVWLGRPPTQRSETKTKTKTSISRPRRDVLVVETRPHETETLG